MKTRYGYVILNHGEFYAFVISKDEAIKRIIGTFGNSMDFKIVKASIEYEDTRKEGKSKLTFKKGDTHIPVEEANMI